MTRLAHGMAGLVLLVLLSGASSAGAHQALEDPYDSGRPLADRMKFDLHDSGLLTEGATTTARPESRFAELAPAGGSGGGGTISTPIRPPSHPYADKVISQPGTSYYVDSDLVLHYVPDGDTHNCLIRTKTVIDRSSVSDAQFNAFSRGPNATCSGPGPAELGQFADKVISQPGTSYYVDSDLVLHYVPDGDTHNCLIRTKTVIDRSSVSDAQFNAFSRGPNATCSGPGPAELGQFADKVISQPGTSYYVDSDLVLHYVPDGDTHNCLIRTKTVIDRSSVSDALFNAFSRGPNATCGEGSL